MLEQTARGGTARAPFWVPTRVQGGAGIQQFAPDTTGTVAAWPRGSGSQFVSFAASPIRLINVCEISNLSIEATSDKEKGLVKFSREEMDKTLLAFENGREALLNSDGTGTIDVISASAVVIEQHRLGRTDLQHHQHGECCAVHRSAGHSGLHFGRNAADGRNHRGPHQLR